MTPRSQQLQIRVTPQQKSALRRRARAAGLGMSEYVLTRVLPEGQDRFAALVRALADAPDPRSVLAEIHDLLATATASELSAAVEYADLDRHTAFHANYLAAMVEQACAQKGVSAPPWTARVRPLEQPYFATDLRSLRAHLLRESPVPFKRRNLFVDAGVGARV